MEVAEGWGVQVRFGVCSGVSFRVRLGFGLCLAVNTAGMEILAAGAYQEYGVNVLRMGGRGVKVLGRLEG